HGGTVERIQAAPRRFNVLACWGQPRVTLSTHMDTVPPFFPSREDSEFIWGRGACDAKGIIAAMTYAAESLLAAGTRDFALLFVVGEERNSIGAKVAAQNPRGSQFLINGEPTENLLALGCKGALRYEITARGRLAHSAYPQLGESAIDKLLDVLRDIRAISLKEDAVLGRGTLNIGTISGGRAPNVVADEAHAEIMFRLVEDAEGIRQTVAKAASNRAEALEILYTPMVRMGALDGLPTTVVSFTTDIPAFAGAWGTPLLLGPGSIHLAHTADERIPKKQLTEAVQLYASLVKRLLAGERIAQI
ncbi:MAG TPA: M20/M25/M40 family metallo-hydrolase, partial [Candidatus Acidoferrales bacterium]